MILDFGFCGAAQTEAQLNEAFMAYFLHFLTFWMLLKTVIVVVVVVVYSSS